jgi:predicted permease
MAPVFLLIFVGWLAAQKNIVDKNAKKVCSSLVTNFVFPALLFNETYQAKPSEIFNGKWMLAFFIVICVMWVIGYYSNKLILHKNTSQSAMQAMLCCFPNMGGMGLPFLALLIGASSALSIAVANVIVACSIIPVTIFLLELGSQEEHSSKNTSFMNIVGFAIFKSLKKPMVAAVLAGLFFSLSGLSHHLPQFIVSSLSIAASSCNFVSLFAVGVAVHGTRIVINKSLSLNLAIKLILNPVIVWCGVILFGLSGIHAEEMIFLLSMPTATTATILAYQWNVEENEASSIYMASTALSVITLPLLLVLMQAFIPGIH